MMSFLRRLLEQAKRTPDAVALSMDGRSLNYRELWHASGRLAERLQQAGLKAGDLAAITGPRSLDLWISVLAVLRAGGGYVPLDASYPRDRLEFMVRDSGVTVLVRALGDTKQAFSIPPEVQVLDVRVDELLGEGARDDREMGGICLDEPELPVYAIYTSGSTGMPKGVLLERKALSPLIEWQLGDSRASLGSTTLQFAPLSFDVHFQEMMGTWCSGGRLLLISEEQRLETLRLIELLERERVERLFLPFIALQSLADIAVSHQKIPRSLREVITAGEQLQVTRSIVQFFEQIPEARLFNHYGPSETHVVTSLLLSGPPASWDALPSIGFPLPHVGLEILDEAQVPVQEGEAGELWILGEALAREYLGRPDLTAERFVDRPNGRGYRTGDLVQRKPNGEIQFLGRLDGQVKVRGYRIELGEIEVELARLPGVREAAAKVIEPRPGDRRIAAYVVVDPGVRVTELRSLLAKKMPEYMVPALVSELRELPRTPSGKVDKRSLPDLSSARPDYLGPIAFPNSERERQLLSIWKRVLGLAEISIEDSFFELGGNSLLALKVISEIERELGHKLRVVQFFERPTVSAHAAVIDGSEKPNAFRLGRPRVERALAESKVAILAMAGRFPGAPSVDALWDLLIQGKDGTTEFSGELARHEVETDLGRYVARRGIIDRPEYFDAKFFGMSPSEARVLDPQQRVLLELAYEALEKAGYEPGSISAKVGVYAGTHNNSYYAESVRAHPEAIGSIGTFATMLLSEKDYVATRIAHKLDLAGPALSIHTACSTSLVAIATAAQHLRAGLCDLAIAGGASLTVPFRSGHYYEEGGMLSEDGHTRTFDARGSGTVFSDGAGIVVLKMLDRALADGDPILAVISGIGLNNDGAEKASFTAPSVIGQATAILEAQKDAGVGAEEISYVEAHGTATPLGDPIEVEALSLAFRETTKHTQFCGIGSVKSNLGHLTAAAGVTGLVKAVLSLEREQIPKSLHFAEPNPKIAFGSSPFFVVSETLPFPRKRDRRRLIGVSSFGVGGTNAHLILEEAPVRGPSGPALEQQLFLVSARTGQALEKRARDLAEYLSTRDLSLADVSFTLMEGRKAFPERAFFVASSHEQARAQLRELPRSARRDPPSEVVFAFPGQGAQHPNMGRALYDSDMAFRGAMDRCAEILEPLLGKDIREILYHTEEAEAARLLRQTRITQPALFAVSYATSRALYELGLRPTQLIGHSVGEFVAACLAGVFELETALRLVFERGRLMQSMEPGSMLSVRALRTDVEQWLPKELDLAAENAEKLCVVAGPTEAIATFARELEARGVASRLLETSHAFHSRSMDAATVELLRIVEGVELKTPQIPILSTVTGEILRDAEATSAAYWAEHLRRPVRYFTAWSKLAHRSDVALIEVGPRKTLTTLSSAAISSERPRPLILPTLGDKAGEAEVTSWLSLLGRLWEHGYPVRLEALHLGERRRRVCLPSYPFERERYFLEAGRATSRSNETRAPEPIVASDAPPPSVRQSQAFRVEPPTLPQSLKETEMQSRSDRLVTELKQLFEQSSGLDFGAAPERAHFIELGVDSLLVTQLSLKIKQRFKVPVSFRQLMEDLPNFRALADHLDAQMPADPAAPAAAPSALSQGAPPLQPGPTHALPQRQLVVPAGGGDSAGLLARLVDLQLAQMALFQQQLSALTGVAQGAPLLAPNLTAPQPDAPSAPSPTQGAAPSAQAAPSEQKSIAYDPTKAFGAIARIYQQSDELTPAQQARLRALEQRYTEKTKSSKAHTAEFRSVHADPRVVTGFKPRIKELIYPIVSQKSSGCRLWDLDGNEYIDALNGFGSNFFGYSAPRIAARLKAQIDTGIEIGPQTELAGKSARLVSELTGMDRAAFCNTGSEAVMGALRIARTVTGRSLVVAFSGSYHGIFDEVIVRDTKNQKPIPAAPGIMAEAVQNMLVLEYGTPETLEVIRSRADELAAVLVEPVQSRRPDFQPKEFLKEVRAITQASGTALIFDEVITGFRTHPGGAQAHFGIEADLATYGKVVGAGMPIGVIAGRNPWMDALDGGPWQYGDASIPTAGVTYFAGTFVRHPLAMAAVHEALTIMKEEGPALQARVNERTTALARDLNGFFQDVGVPLQIRHFASLWKTFFTEPQPYGELLFCYLRDLGIHIYDGFPCFLTLAHGDEEISRITSAFRAAVSEMQAGGFLPKKVEVVRSQAADSPPVPGARLGRDRQGNPAWFVPDPNRPGAYLEWNSGATSPAK